jgi:NDP-sugar pyrophosphorylase family protein
MINLMPMAGLGTRFLNAGYKLPKPLIPVSGVPMVLNVIKDLPKADKWIFVMKEEHIKIGVDKLIKQEIPNAIIISVKETTSGQACTCLLAEKYINPEEELFIISCDNGFLYNDEKFNELKSREDVDCIAWTFTEKETLKRNPTSWGWFKLEEDNETIKDISVKIPISDNPYKDHAVVSSFWFKKAKDFLESTKLMIKDNYRINGEFYIDALPKFLKRLNKKSVIFDVDLYVGWGKPEDLHDYELAEIVTKYGIIPEELSEENKNLIPLWRKYFKL